LFVRGTVLILGPCLLVFIQVSVQATQKAVSPDDEHVSPNRILYKYRRQCTSPWIQKKVILVFLKIWKD